MRRSSYALVVVVAAALSATGTARAHFVLQSPAAWMSQDAAGAPEKLGPCGNEGGGTPTGTVTPFHPGDTVTVTVNEVVFHPGHYRFALSETGQSGLPAEPVVTPGANTPCGTAAIENPPMYPVLADDVFDHTAPFSTPQTIKITLPTNVTCTKCTLQIIEFMSDHPLNNPGGCFYHHCADISIDSNSSGDGGGSGGSSGASSGGSGGGSGGGSSSGAGDDGGGPGPDGGGNKAGGNASNSSGCACSALGGDASNLAAPLALLFGATGLLRRRRR